MPKESPWLTHTGVKPPPEIKLEPEHQPHYAAWKATPSPATTGALLKSVAPVIDTGVKAYGGANANPMMRSHAKKLAINAFATYDPAQSPLKNHLLSHLQGLQRYGAKQTQMLAVPERVAIDKQRLDAAEAELRDYHGRDASTLELADHLGMSPKRIGHVRGYTPGFAEGQAEAAPAMGDDDGGGGGPAVEQPDATVHKLEFIYHDLDPINQAILEHGYGLHGRPKLRIGDIAKRLNLSAGAVSQRGKVIQHMLDQLDDTGVL